MLISSCVPQARNAPKVWSQEWSGEPMAPESPRCCPAVVAQPVAVFAVPVDRLYPNTGQLEHARRARHEQTSLEVSNGRDHQRSGTGEGGIKTARTTAAPAIYVHGGSRRVKPQEKQGAGVCSIRKGKEKRLLMLTSRYRPRLVLYHSHTRNTTRDPDQRAQQKKERRLRQS